MRDLVPSSFQRRSGRDVTNNTKKELLAMQWNGRGRVARKRETTLTANPCKIPSPTWYHHFPSRSPVRSVKPSNSASSTWTIATTLYPSCDWGWGPCVDDVLSLCSWSGVTKADGGTLKLRNFLARNSLKELIVSVPGDDCWWERKERSWINPSQPVHSNQS